MVTAPRSVNFVFATALALTGCSTGLIKPKLPELREPISDKFLPAVREEIDNAYRAVKANPRDPGANGRLGMVLHAYGQNQAAAVAYDRAEILEPEAFRWRYYRGVVEAAEGNYSGAVTALQGALAKDTGYLGAQIKLAECLLALGRAAEASAIYEQALRLRPGEAAAHYGLGRTYAARGKSEKAAESYRNAVELFPQYGTAHYALGLLYRNLGQNERARRHISLYERHKDNQPPIQDELMLEVSRLNLGPTNLIDVGRALAATGRLHEAVAAHEKALERNPEIVQAHVNLIQLFGQLEKPQKAEEHYRAAIALNRDAAEGHYNFGVLMFSLKNYTDAEQAFREALRSSPLYPEAHNNLAYLLERQGKVNQAMDHYRKALQIQPDFRLAHYHLGRLLLARRRYAEGMDHLLTTLTPQDEMTSRFLYAVAIGYRQSGDRDKALTYALQARELATANRQGEILTQLDAEIRRLETAR